MARPGLTWQATDGPAWSGRDITTAADGGSRLRIALIAPPWLPVPPPAYGGTELVIDLLARGLQDAGHDVVLVATADSTCPVPLLASGDIAQWNLDQPGSLLTELSHVLWAYQQPAVRNADVVHDHTLVGPFVAPTFGVRRVVTTNHGPFDGELARMYQAMGDRAHVVAISHDQARGHDGPIAAVIHHGIDLDGYADQHDPSVDDHLLFLGRVHPDKGLHLAIEAARRSGSRLVIAAKMREPAERAYFDDCIRPHLDDDIRYVGEVGPLDKRDLLGRARALLNPIQWREPFGLVMAEALASGTPVITTRTGAAPEIVDHGLSGFVCDDTDGLVDAIDMLDEIDRTTCRRIAVERFGHHRMAADHAWLYRRVAAAPPTETSRGVEQMSLSRRLAAELTAGDASYLRTGPGREQSHA